MELRMYNASMNLEARAQHHRDDARIVGIQRREKPYVPPSTPTRRYLEAAEIVAQRVQGYSTGLLQDRFNRTSPSPESIDERIKRLILLDSAIEALIEAYQQCYQPSEDLII